MAKSGLTAPHFQNDEAARAIVESLRWPSGPVCGHCGETERRYATKRPGRYRCGNPACRKDYTVTTGTVMESSHVPLHKWMAAFYLLSSSKKGFSAHQLHRTLGLTYKTAWFLHHRVTEAMRQGGLDLPPMGGSGKIVEADETYYGDSKLPRERRKYSTPFTKGGKGSSKRAIVALVERGGKVRTFHVPRADKATVSKIVMENIHHETRLHTDESNLYFGADKHFATHETVKHSAKEYARGDVNTNSAEGYFSIFKRGMRGVYQHCSEKHLHRYLAEYDFRYNHRSALGFGDEARTNAAVKGAIGKRLTYQRPN
ncbi:MAG: IS1595 family transposase [Alphaproteobacteria bacterium]|nr:IS1595 family transposase [Alphaproteobacteria bacterium]